MEHGRRKKEEEREELTTQKIILTESAVPTTQRERERERERERGRKEGKELRDFSLPASIIQDLKLFVLSCSHCNPLGCPLYIKREREREREEREKKKKGN